MLLGLLGPPSCTQSGHDVRITLMLDSLLGDLGEDLSSRVHVLPLTAAFFISDIDCPRSFVLLLLVLSFISHLFDEHVRL